MRLTPALLYCIAGLRGAVAVPWASPSRKVWIFWASRPTTSRYDVRIVDDVYSTGSSVQAVIDQLTRKTRRNLPHDIRIATVWYRPSERTIREPDFYVHETEDWLALPYELSGMSIAELRENRREISAIIDRLEPLVNG